MTARKSSGRTQLGKVTIARMVALRIRGRLGRNLRAIGVVGSVARGMAEIYSDVDMLVMVKRLRRSLPTEFILRGTYCSINQRTLRDAIDELTVPSDRLPEIIGGYRKILPLYDPGNLMPYLERTAAKIPNRVFRRSAQLALLHSYEDFCRVKNAYLDHDEVVLIDSAQYVTYSAALAVASLNRTGFNSDREIFKAHQNYSKLPKGFQRIERLRYQGLVEPRTLYATLLEFYVNLVRFCRTQGLSFPVSESSLRQLKLCR